MFKKLIALITSFFIVEQVASANEANGDKILLNTSKGEVIINLMPEIAPVHVARIVELVKSGFYDGVIFHRIIPGFMAQTGDPKGNGTGGSGTNLKAEFSDYKYINGTVGMARTMDPHSATSQFFINHKDNNFLNHTGENPQGWGYAVFGKVTEGMDVVDKIADVATGSSGGHQDVPVDLITIESVTVSE